MPMPPAHWLVDTDWLASHLAAPDVVVLDGSMHLPTSGRNARAEYKATHIPGALYFDIDAVADKKNPLPHMLPSSVQFSSQVKAMGIGDGSRIIVYDSEGLYSAARVWWMFRVMGHQDVAVLNGGLKKWQAEGRPVTDWESAKPSDTAKFGRLFHHLLERGIYFPPSQFEAAFVSAVHTPADIAATGQALRDFS